MYIYQTLRNNTDETSFFLGSLFYIESNLNLEINEAFDTTGYSPNFASPLLFLIFENIPINIPVDSLIREGAQYIVFDPSGQLIGMRRSTIPINGVFTKEIQLGTDVPTDFTLSISGLFKESFKFLIEEMSNIILQDITVGEERIEIKGFLGDLGTISFNREVLLFEIEVLGPDGSRITSSITPSDSVLYDSVEEPIYNDVTEISNNILFFLEPITTQDLTNILQWAKNNLDPNTSLIYGGQNLLSPIVQIFPQDTDRTRVTTSDEKIQIFKEAKIDTYPKKVYGKRRWVFSSMDTIDLLFKEVPEDDIKLIRSNKMRNPSGPC